MSDKQQPWQVLRRETIYTSPWVRLHRDDVRLPDGTIVDGHHVVDFPRPAVCVVPVGSDGRILLIEHYRFITDTLGWELPAGRVEENEALEQAAARELHEEAGTIVERLEYLGVFYPCNGSTNLTFHIFIGHGALQEQTPIDTNETLRLAWFEPGVIWGLVEQNQIRDGLTLTGLLWYLARTAFHKSADDAEKGSL